VFCCSAKKRALAGRKECRPPSCSEKLIPTWLGEGDDDMYDDVSDAASSSPSFPDVRESLLILSEDMA